VTHGLAIDEVRGPHRHAVEPDGETFELVECRRYELRLRADRVEVDGRSLERIGSGWVLSIGHWASPAPLVLRGLDAGAEVARARLRVIPRADKLSEQLWLAMLEDLEAWLPGTSVGMEGGRVGEVGRSGAASPLLAEALLPLVPALLHAAHAVVDGPRLRQRSRWEEVPLHQARRADREAIRWALRHPDANVALDPWRDLGRRQPRFLQRRTDDRLDHPANRYVAWLIHRVAAVLDRLAGELDALAERGVVEDGAWTTSRAERARRGSIALGALVDRSFLRDLAPTPPSEAALQVVLDDPVYGRVHRLGRPFLAPRFQLTSDGTTPASIRPTFHLYELWCLLAVQRQLAEVLPEWTWTARGLGALLSSGTGSGAAFVASGPGGARVQLQFNPTFPGWFNRGPSARFSISAERRPDLVVTFDGPRGRAWLVLDAKWRVGRTNLGDAFTSVHVYRVALRDEDRGGPCRGAALLAPSVGADCADWFTAGFRERHGCGVLNDN
jgi:hypothetical protein